MMIIASRDVTQFSTAYRQWLSEETATSEISVNFFPDQAASHPRR